jgi:RluA family pseudouridine synthase
VARPQNIELPDGTLIPILYEDRSVIAIDKPVSWMLLPYNWDKSSRNLHLAISSSILARDYWARSRTLKYLRNVHRLDADTSGVLLFARSPGALHTFSRLFESHRMEKKYLAVVDGIPKECAWTCKLKIAPDAAQLGRRKIDARNGKDAETHFTVLATQTAAALVEARPITGRTHQIRLHLAASGCPVRGDVLYGKGVDRLPGPKRTGNNPPLALRAVVLAYSDPFQKRRVRIQAPTKEFCEGFGFSHAEGEPSRIGRHHSTVMGSTP